MKNRRSLFLTAWVIACLAGLLGSLLGGGACERHQGYTEGANLYRVHCSNCHLENGQGLGALIPPLAQSDYLGAHRERLPCIIRYGLKDTIVVNNVVYAEAMAGIESLSDIQITNLLNYIHTSWGNDLPPYRLDEVRRLLERCR